MPFHNPACSWDMFQHVYIYFGVLWQFDDGLLAVALVELVLFVHQRIIFNNIYYSIDQLLH
jgi:hypothetical protein